MMEHIIYFSGFVMKTFLLVVVLLLSAVVIFFFVLGSKSKAGTANGLVDGQLSRCGSKPNCVCSEQHSQGEHSVAAFELTDSNNLSLQPTTEIIEAAGGQIVQQDEHYLAATFTSRLFGYVDDFEVRLDTDSGILHFRSASRVGHSDLGANRKRVEAIKAALLQIQPPN